MAAVQITRLSCSGVPGRKYAANPSVFGLETIEFAGRTSELVVASLTFPLVPRFTVLTESCQKRNVGVVLLVPMTNPETHLPVDVSAATDIAIKIGLPDGTTKDFVGALLTDGVDGKIYYVTADGDDLPEAGVYTIQGRVIGPGYALSSRPERFQVYDNIDDD